MSPIDYLTFTRQIARGAGDILLRYFEHSPEIKPKGFHDVVTEADLACEQYIADEIKKHFPEHKILSEETIKDEFANEDFAWIIDPLDGTNNFSFGISFFATSIALWHDGCVQAGVVFLPKFDQMFYAEKGKGAFLNDRKLNTAPDQQDRILLLAEICTRDLNRTTQTVKQIESILPQVASFKALGAMAADLAYVAKIPGVCQFGSLFYPWDIAAGALIAEEAGARVTDFEGDPWTIDSKSCLAAHPSIHQKIIKTFNQGTKAL